jgi:thiaminase
MNKPQLALLARVLAQRWSAGVAVEANSGHGASQPLYVKKRSRAPGQAVFDIIAGGPRELSREMSREMSRDVKISRFAQLAEAVLGRELELHRSYAADWGISTAELEAAPATATTRGYTDFLLRVAALGDYGELAAALLPCMWAYHELATRLAKRGRPSNALYARWIDEYAGREFAELTSWCQALTNAAAETGDHRRMTDAFLSSSRYELAFWNASWHEEPPLREPETPASTGK